MESSIRLFCVLVLFGLTVASEDKRCPSLSVSPCICVESPLPTLVCDKVTEIDVLRTVFLNSAGATYHTVKLTNTVVQYLPHDLFEGVEVLNLQLINSTLVQIFNKKPENVESLLNLHIKNTRILRDFNWELFEPMVNLMVLNVSSNKITALGNQFAQHAPKSLQEISLNGTRTRKIKSGVFELFLNLDRVTIVHCPLKELKRNIFPHPFNGRNLIFNDNQLSSLPEDMFTDMPNMQYISLKRNNLTTVPPYIFQSLQFLNLEGNPLNCDCNLAWMAERYLNIKGTCSSPPELAGRDVTDAIKSLSC